MNTSFSLVVSLLLSAFFLFASSIKILGWQKRIFDVQSAFFESYGLKRQHMVAVGVVELYGALTLWFPSYLGATGSLALLLTSIGALYFHLKYDTWRAGVPAMITLLLSGTLAVEKLRTFSAGNAA